MSPKEPEGGLFGGLRAAVSRLFGTDTPPTPPPAPATTRPAPTTARPAPPAAAPPAPVAAAAPAKVPPPAPDTPPGPDRQALREAGFSAAKREDWTAADTAWAELRRQIPGDVDGWLHGAWALLQLDRPAEARAMLTTALAEMPGQSELLIGAGYHAAFRKDWPEAVGCWARVRLAIPGAPDGWVHGATALRHQDRFDEAEMLLRQGIAQLPDRYDLRARQAYLASERGDWNTARARWQALAKSHPGNPEIATALRAAEGK